MDKNKTDCSTENKTSMSSACNGYTKDITPLDDHMHAPKNGPTATAKTAIQDNKNTTNEQEPKLTRWQQFRAIYRTVFIMLHNAYCIPSYFVWMIVFRPLLYFKPDLYWQIEGVMYNWLLSIVGYWLQSAGYTVAESGADINYYVNEEAIVLVNHQSTADVPLIMYTLGQHPGVHSSMLWIMEAVFKFTNFGWVSMVHGDFFILQGKATRSQELVRLAKHMKTVYKQRDRKWVILFPEGGFLRKRLQTSQKYASNNGYPVLNHVTLPRVGAMKSIIDTLSDTKQPNGTAGRAELTESGDKSVKWVIDMTVAYPDGGKPLDAFRILAADRPACQTQVHYRVFPVHEIPRGEEGLTQWLYKRWEEKEQLLDTVYKTGHFLVQNTEEAASAMPQVKEQQLYTDDVWLISLHLFFLVSAYAQFTLISDLLGLFM